MQRKRAFIEPDTCSRCDVCPSRNNCPTGAIVREERGEPWYVDVQCIGCGKCVRQCVLQAITLV